MNLPLKVCAESVVNAGFSPEVHLKKELLPTSLKLLAELISYWLWEATCFFKASKGERPREERRETESRDGDREREREKDCL